MNVVSRIIGAVWGTVLFTGGILKEVFSPRFPILLKISWRNLWRNMRRSLITLGAIIAGLWGLIAIYGANNGMLVGLVNVAIMAHTSHIQVHEAGYHENPEISVNFSGASEIAEKINNIKMVAATAPRTKVWGMVSTAGSSSGVTIVGIDPDKEAAVSSIDDGIVAGRYFKEGDKKGILIGSGLADKLKAKPGKKMVVYARGADNELKAMGLDVIGVFDTGTDNVDKFMAFIPIDYFQENLNLAGKIHEIAIRLEDDKDLELAKKAIRDALPERKDLEVLSWKDMFAFLVQMTDFAKIGNWAMLVVVGIAMALGIANTMIMSVFERFRELGIMKAVGTNPAQVFLMILVESMLLCLVGLIAGSALGWVTILIWGEYGLDLSVYSESLKSVGMPAVIYAEVYLSDYVMTWAAVILMAVGGCIYPAIKASRQSPVEAMRM